MPFAEDLALFFNPDEFGTDAFIGNKKIAGIFSHAFMLVNDVETRKPVFTCSENHLIDISYDNNIQIEQQSYHILGVKPDGIGCITLVLEKNL